MSIELPPAPAPRRNGGYGLLTGSALTYLEPLPEAEPLTITSTGNKTYKSRLRTAVFETAPLEVLATEQVKTAPLEVLASEQVKTYAAIAKEDLAKDLLTDPTTGLPVPNTINHFPNGNDAVRVRAAQLRLVKWGRPLLKPDPTSPYGVSGPLFPGDFGIAATDTDGEDSARTGLAIASFQRWYTQDQGKSLGAWKPSIFDEATAKALASVAGEVGVIDAPDAAPIPTGVPTGGTVIPFPDLSGGGLPTPSLPGIPSGSSSSPAPLPIPSVPGVPGPFFDPTTGLPKSVPGSIYPQKDQATASPSWVKWVLIALGVGTVLFVGYYVVTRNKSRRRRKA